MVVASLLWRGEVERPGGEEMVRQPKSRVIRAERCREVDPKILEGVVEDRCFVNPDEVNGHVSLSAVAVACRSTGSVYSRSRPCSMSHSSMSIAHADWRMSGGDQARAWVLKSPRRGSVVRFHVV